MFQYRVTGDTPGGFRTVEERIILIYAADASAAYAAAQAKGKSAKFNYRNDLDARVYFEFVGVIDLMHLGVAGLAPTLLPVRPRHLGVA
jgi:hypothetical protein